MVRLKPDQPDRWRRPCYYGGAARGNLANREIKHSSPPGPLLLQKYSNHPIIMPRRHTVVCLSVASISRRSLKTKR